MEVNFEAFVMNLFLDFGNPIEPLVGGTDAYVVLTGDHVTTSDGTGIVHTAPSLGLMTSVWPKLMA